MCSRFLDFCIALQRGIIIPGVIKVPCLGGISHIREVYELRSSQISKKSTLHICQPKEPNTNVPPTQNPSSLSSFLPSPFPFFPLHYAVPIPACPFPKGLNISFNIPVFIQAIPVWSIWKVHILCSEQAFEYMGSALFISMQFRSESRSVRGL